MHGVTDDFLENRRHRNSFPRTRAWRKGDRNSLVTRCAATPSRTAPFSQCIHDIGAIKSILNIPVGGNCRARYL